MSIIEQLGVAENTTSTEAFVSDIPSTKDFVGLYRNSNEEICRYFDDLVNNDYHYHKIDELKKNVNQDSEGNFDFLNSGRNQNFLLVV